MRWFKLILLLVSAYNASSQTMVMTQRCMDAVDLLMDLEHDSAMALIAAEEKQNPNNATIHYLYNLSDFLTTVVSEDESFFARQEDEKARRMKAILKVSDSNPYRKFALAEINLQWAFSRLRFGEYFKAALEINRAFHLLEQNIEEHPDFLPNLKGMGLLHALIGTVPEKYRWATDLMGVNGTISVGLNELEKVVNECDRNPEFRFLKKESLFLYSFIVLNLTSDLSVLEKVSEPLNRLSMESPMIAFAHASHLSETGKTEDAIEILQNCGNTNRPLRFHYLDHLLGSMQLYNMDQDSKGALEHYRANFKGKSYLKANQLKLAYHQLIFFNSENRYLQELNKIGAMGSTMLDEDKQAQKAFEKGTVPNILLLKARLLFDGGFYRKALQMLTDSEVSEFNLPEENLEFDYRMGRIHHRMGNNKMALDFYRRTIMNHEVDGTYYPANACLKMANIYESENNRQKAIQWYEASMEYSDHEYENSIEQKARAGISRLE